jgi:hypothetical protein
VLTPEQLQKLAAIQQRAREQQQGTGQSAPQGQTPPPQSNQQAPPQH